MRLWILPVAIPLLRLLLIIAAFTQSSPSEALPLEEMDHYCATNPYGIDGELSEADLNALFYIAFPQTSGDMRGRFGSPMCMDTGADCYRVEGTDHYIVVDFDRAMAIGWRAWDAQ